MQGKWRERCRNDGGSIERKEEGGGKNSGKHGGGTVCHALFYSHPEASERRQIPADYSVVLSNTKDRKCVCLRICRVLDKDRCWNEANIYTVVTHFTSFSPHLFSALYPDCSLLFRLHFSSTVTL